jgi:hypothetical protein
MVHEEDVEVVVEDTGIGIAPEQMQHIFSEFHQVSGTLRRRYGGTGLGLSICKQFVTLHNGRIWAESEVGKGSAFHFKLPLPGKESVPLQRSLPPVGGYYPGIEAGVPRRLVTLAQPAEFARLLRRHLSRVDILVAEDARHCAQMARTYQADAVVLSEEVADEALAGGIAAATADLMLPVVTCAVPLERHLALAAGFTHCLMKPFGADQLVRTIEQMAPDARRVLVVDDDQGVVRLIERSLAAAMPRLEVLTAYDGVEAIGLLEREPDLVLLDLLLPRANGLVVLQEQRLREQRAGSASTPTPVVAITAHGFEQDIAALGQGSISLRRGRYYSAEDITQWLQLMVDFRPARHLAAPGAIGPEPLFSGPEPGPALAPAPTA